MSEASDMSPHEWDVAARGFTSTPNISGTRMLVICGSRAALVALRDAIDRALTEKNGEAETIAFAGDGEGYRIEIRRIPRSAVQRSRLPYTRLEQWR